LNEPRAELYCAPMAEDAKSRAKKRFVDFLLTKSLRLTSQRKAIVDSVFSTEEHFTAEQLLKWSQSRDNTVSRATIYRTLPLLTESGLVREMDFGQDHRFYDPNYAEHPHHNHIICEDCQTIVEFDSAQIEKVEDEMAQKLGFSVKTHRLQITGSCEQLKRMGSCKRKTTSCK
jgi:Fur family ferric uptake transcriptional regulator